jgi:hypothetical protein
MVREHQLEAALMLLIGPQYLREILNLLAPLPEQSGRFLSR